MIRKPSPVCPTDLDGLPTDNDETLPTAVTGQNRKEKGYRVLCRRMAFKRSKQRFTMKALLVAIIFRISVAAAASCERLQQSLTYTQEEAPRDLSGVVSLICVLLLDMCS